MGIVMVINLVNKDEEKKEEMLSSLFIYVFEY